MRSELEFHDSTILSIAQAGASIQIGIDGYIHRWDKASGVWKGEGWGQPVQITLTGALGSNVREYSKDLDGGSVRIGAVTHNNCIRLPFHSAGPAILQLELKTGEVLEFTGNDIKIEVTGSGSFIEPLPDDFKPTDAG